MNKTLVRKLIVIAAPLMLVLAAAAPRIHW